ncbi:hypothetical protein BCR36DRAFT_142112 [Piromyces finnis]|uniref:L domain-like protein n=1 Tax=Piromyces finnis TaxID=1754191 RepID=A0A1Y1UYZ6_9FUNG|nr:hypothetical protein BCR36DRAFT_142112 [Piromyces finnis]|eukprot:ORX43628.1 hypothetical protein BCR36DRAFT_142112 [Piromyces finnis]
MEMYNNLKKKNNSFYNHGTYNLNEINERENNEFFKNFDFEINKLINLEEEQIINLNEETHKDKFNFVDRNEISISNEHLSLKEIDISLNSIINEDNIFLNEDEQLNNTDYDNNIFDYVETVNDTANERKINNSQTEIISPSEIAYTECSNNPEIYGEIIDMSNQNLMIFNNNSYNLRNVKKLRLDNNLIESIEISSPILTYLSVTNNKLQTIEKLKDLKNLIYLDLSNNNISVLTPLSKLNNLKELYLNNNNISDFSILYSLKKLIHLSLKNNKIITIKPSRERILWESLDLSNNKIQIINNLENFTYLKYLSLNKNNIYNICIKKPIPNLKTLHINKSLIIKFDEFYFPNLTELYINDSIVEQIKNCYLMSDLKTLSIQSKVPLTNNPLNIKFSDLTNIKELFILNRRILKLEELYLCKNLNSLILSSCNIDSIPLGLFKDMYELKYLNLNNNKIKNIKEILYLKNLEELYLVNNMIVIFPPFLNTLKMLMNLKILDIRENPVNKAFYSDIQKQNDIYNDNILPDVFSTFNELMVEKGETKNLRFICYYHLIVSTMPTSLISLDTFFVTDSDRRKSVIELEKLKNYYEKSLLLESQIKESDFILNTEEFEDRMQINYEINNIINEFWGYNEIKKYYENNKKLKEKIKLEKRKQQTNDKILSENESNLTIFNNLNFSNIDNPLNNYNLNENVIESKNIEEIIINNDIGNENVLNDLNKIKNDDILKCKKKNNLLTVEKIDNKLKYNKSKKNKIINNKNDSFTLTESIKEFHQRNKNIHNKLVVPKENYNKENNSGKQSKTKKSKEKTLKSTIIPAFRPLSHHGDLFKSTFIAPLPRNNSNLIKLKSKKMDKRTNLKKEKDSLKSHQHLDLNNKVFKYNSELNNNKFKLYNELNDANTENKYTKKTHKNSSISLKKAKSNISLAKRTIKVSLSNPKYSIEKNANPLTTTTETLYRNLNSKKSNIQKNIISTISIDTNVRNNIHKLHKKNSSSK